jgi:polar amino acid transport system ATP-binding protein
LLGRENRRDWPQTGTCRNRGRPRAGTIAALLIEVAGLRKVVVGTTILDGLSMSVQAGEIVVVVGASGAGKTTLLRCLIGLDRVDAGTIRVGDHQFGSETPDGDPQLLGARRRIGFVFQQWNLFANRNVIDNVTEAPIHVMRKSRADATARAHALLDRVGIAHRASAYPSELSGGEQQRAAIARALAMDPDVLLLDEPTSALDAARADDLFALLRELSAAGLTLVIVSHDQRLPQALGARVLTLAQGRIG